jgi:hypothetical protein
LDLKELKQTDIWDLYEQCLDYCNMMGVFSDTDLNYRMYNGDQWHGLKIQGVEKVQYNFIKPIVRYKVGIIMTNLYGIVYSSENFENKAFRKTGEKICQLLNKKASRIWERDYMDLKLRNVVKDSAINDEGIIYVTLDSESGLPVNEILNKTDIFYGNENDSDIQSQPYILIKQRKPVIEVRNMAEQSGVPKNEIERIIGDNDTFEEAGDSAKYEKDDMCTVVTKMYKESGTVHFERATKYVEIIKDKDSGLTYYPVTHILWEEKKGSARGEGEVRHLIPNQLETNKTAMRRAFTVKNTAYQQKVVNIDKIMNPASLDAVGGTIKVRGNTVDDVSKIITFINPAQMSPDVEKLQNELIQSTRELAGAGEIATGEVNPENASGRAILAVQQAATQPLTEHLQYVKGFVEDLARIWLDFITVYNDEVVLEDEYTDPVTGEESVALVKVPKETLLALQAVVRVDITPKGAFDKYAQEQSLENLLTAGLFNSQRMPELKLYVRALDDDSVMPKQKLEKVIEEWEKEQQKIAVINAQAQLMQQRAQRFLMGDPDEQSSMVADALTQANGAQMMGNNEPTEQLQVV